MTEPNENTKSVVERATFLRGKYLTSYAQVEFVLGDIWLCCQAIPEYAGHLPERFPSPLNQRLSIIRKIFTLDGPLSPYAEEIGQLAEGITHFSQFRHFMAHAMLRVVASPTNHRLDYILHSTDPQAAVKTGEIRTNLDELGYAAGMVTEYAHEMMTACKRMYIETGMKPPVY